LGVGDLGFTVFFNIADVPLRREPSIYKEDVVLIPPDSIERASNAAVIVTGENVQIIYRVPITFHQKVIPSNEPLFLDQVTPAQAPSQWQKSNNKPMTRLLERGPTESSCR
jgi:hypothetical protein